MSVPVVAVATDVDGHALVRRAEALEFEIGVSHVDGDPDTWVYIGASPGQQIEVSLESARRLMEEVGRRLRLVDADSACPAPPA